MFTSIDGAKKIISKQVKRGEIYDVTYPFIKHSKIYINTNENIQDCFNLIDFNKVSNALAVLSSGDYLFNLILRGVYSIDTFDSNTLTEYYVLGLKMAMIEKYDYNTFIYVNQRLIDKNTTLDEITNIIYDLLPYMDKKYKKYWHDIADYNYKLQKNSKNPINLFSLLAYEREKLNKEANTYMLDESNYNQLKKAVRKANITFKCADAINPSNIANNETYDLILLSNILDYYFNQWGLDWGYEKLSDYVKKLYKISNEDATILLAYCLAPDKQLIKNSIIKESNLNGDTHEINSFFSPEKKDIIILNRKKKYAGKETIYTSEWVD